MWLNMVLDLRVDEIRGSTGSCEPVTSGVVELYNLEP
jgi:hypothetical protein